MMYIHMCVCVCVSVCVSLIYFSKLIEPKTAKVNYNVNYNKEYILGLCSLFKAALLKQLEFP